MKNILLGTIALSALFAASSCTKQKTVESTGQWILDGTTHYVKQSQTFANGAQGYMVNDVNGNQLYFYFGGLPTMNGVYRVVSNSNPQENQIYIAMKTIGQQGYQSIGNDSTDAMVTFSPSQVNIAVPDIWIGNTKLLINDSTWKPTDSSVLSANASFARLYVPPPVNGGSGFWKMGPYGFTPTTVQKNLFSVDTSSVDSVAVTATDGLQNKLVLWFKKYPTATGQYKPVTGAVTNANDVRIVNTLFWGVSYVCTNVNTVVTVTSFTDGIGISIPATWVVNTANHSDSLRLTGVIMKNN